MFVWSIKTSKRELLILLIGILCFIAALVYVFWPTGAAATSALASEGYSLKAENSQDMVKFLLQFGWEADPQCVENAEVAIPLEFTDTYENYNKIQKTCGFDLEAYKGKRVKRWTYKINNYPGELKNIYANILVYDNTVIGGDICSPALDGFMHSFKITDAQETKMTVNGDFMLPNNT